MRLATVRLDNQFRVAVVDQDAARLLPLEEGDMVTLIGKGRNHIDKLAARQDLTSIPLNSAVVCAPVQRFQSDILCTGWNYWDHFEESRGKREGQDVDRPNAPTFFTKRPNSVTGPNDDIGLDPYISAKWDYEAEVALIIGKQCRNVPAEKALDYVFGYCLANDVSQRDLQRRHGGQWLKGKSIDRTMPLGPWIVTPEELDVPNIRLELHLNGERLQSALVKQMAFTISELIAELSFGMTLEVGDVLLTGTPSGIGNAREPQIFLKPGDEMIVSATGLGTLRNRVVSADLHGKTSVASMSEPK